MRKSELLFAAAGFVAVCASVPAQAQKDACVASNRIQTTKAVDNRTVLVTDKDKKPFTIHMRGACIGLDQYAQLLTFRTKTQLGCIGPGDSVSYSLPGDNTRPTVRGVQTQQTCFVESVTAGAPPDAAK